MRSLFIPIKLAFRSIRANAARTALSLLGIVIGVASVILVLSFGGGVKQFIVDQVNAFGSDIMEIEVKVPKVNKMSSQNAGGIAGGMQITTFKLADAEKVGKLPNVSSWYAAFMTQQVVSYGGKNKQTYIMGTTADVTKVDGKMIVEKGESFTEDDDRSLRQVAVLGSKIATDFFGQADPVGKDIKIKGQNYRVIGVLKKRGAAAMFDFDSIIYLPLQTTQKKLAGVNYLQYAIFKLKDMSRLDLSILNATDIMREQHDIRTPDDDDFSVNSIVEITQILDKVFFSINILLLALVSISLIVGGVGIMNVMYVTVTERTYEIGLKKSVGARGSQIMTQFLFEAVFITMLGGIIGVLLGIGISKAGEIVAAHLGYTLVFPVTWLAVAIGLGFSAGTGIIFGYFPARRASRMSPMEALRKE